MKRLVCEMCGGTDLIKQDGVFVCQSCGCKYSVEEARKMLKEVIDNGKALEVFKTFLASQGGDASVVDDPSKLPNAPYKIELPATQEGYIKEIVADEIGTAAMMLGAGRETKDSVIDLAVGLVLHKKVGDFVKEGEALLTIHSNTEDVEKVKQVLYNNIVIVPEKVEAPQLIRTHITKD